MQPGQQGRVAVGGVSLAGEVYRLEDGHQVGVQFVARQHECLFTARELGLLRALSARYREHAEGPVAVDRSGLAGDRADNMVDYV